MSTIKKWFKKLKPILKRITTKMNTDRMDLTDQEKKLLMKMRLEEKEIHQSPVPYADPNEEKKREELKEKLRRRKEIIDRFLEVC